MHLEGDGHAFEQGLSLFDRVEGQETNHLNEEEWTDPSTLETHASHDTVMS